MNITRLSPDDFLIHEKKTLKDALVVITNNRKGTAVVVDEAGRLMGILSDGDIRRALLKGAMELTPVSKFLNTNSKFLRNSISDEEIVKLFEENVGVNLVPLIDTNNIVTAIAVEV